MLLRGQNLVGYRHYGDDIVRRFVYKAAENGMDVFRVFDALNDIRNYETAAAAIKETGKHFQGAVVYTISPVHSLDHYVEVAHKLVDMGADSICIKDMAALLSPFYGEQLVGRLKAELSVPIQLHCHYIGGLAPMTYLKAVEAGVDVIDTATVPLAFGNSQPATEMVVSALTGSAVRQRAGPREALRDGQVLREGPPGWRLGARRHVAHAHAGVLAPGPGRDDQQPGEPTQGAERARPSAGGARGDPGGAGGDRVPAARHPHEPDRRHAGRAQRALRSALAHRPDEMKQYLRGKYGAAPGPVSKEVLTRVLEGEEPIGVRPADLVDETLEDYREEIGELARSEEDLLSYALFPQTARLHLERHHVGPESDVFQIHDRYLASQPGAALLDQSADRVKDILGMIEESEVDEVVIEEGDIKITVRKAGVEPVAVAAPAATPQAAPVAAAPRTAPTAITSSSRSGWPRSTGRPRRRRRRSSRSATRSRPGRRCASSR